MKPILTLMLMLFAISAGAQTGADEHKVIFPAEKKLRLYGDTIYKRFTPGTAEINKADSIASLYIPLNRDKYAYNKTEIKDYRNYFKQYTGLIIDGEKVIFINAACVKLDCFLTSICGVKGGGSCFFDIKIDLASGQVLEFRVNGPK